jgi:hypothetical protein
LWFWGFLLVTLYAIVSVAIAMATADTCEGRGDPSWAFAPPHWECQDRFG